MAERKIPYIIELIADDKKLRQQMSSWNWEDIMGRSNGKGFKDTLVKDTDKAKQEIVRTLGGLGLDWGKILGEKEFGLLEKKIAKVITANTEKLKVFGRDSDTTGIQETIERVSTLGNELKELGSGFDAPSLVRNFGAFMKVLTPLSAKIEQLSKEPEKVAAAFDRIFGEITITANNMTQSSTKVVNVFARMEAALKGTGGIEKQKKNLEELYDLLSSDPSAKFPDFSKMSVDQLLKEVEKLDKLWDDIDKKANYGAYTTQQQGEVAKIEAQLVHINKLLPDGKKILVPIELGGQKYGASPEDYLKDIQAEADKTKQKLAELNEQIEKSLGESFAKAISKQISDIKLSVSLSDKEKSKFINEINTFVQDINKSPLEEVKIGVAQALDDSANLIEDKSTRAYKDKPADDDVNTTKLIAQTEKRFKGIRGAMYKNQNKILNATKDWRKQMLDQFKFKSGDFEFKFNDTLIESLQSLFDDYALKVNIDPQHLAEQITTVLNSSGGAIGGGTANIDASSMASAIAIGLRAALTGEMPQVVISSGNVDDNDGLPEEISHIATEIEQTGKHLDIAEDYVKDVVEKLKAVAKYATRHIGTDKDTKGAITTRDRFDLLGIDLKKVKNASDVGNDTEIVSMLENSLLQKDEFGKLKGSTVIDELSNFKGSSSKTISAFLKSMDEVFFMLQEDTQSVEEWTRKRQGKEVLDSARKIAQDAVSLQKVRLSAKNGDIPSLNEIDDLTSILEPYWKRVASQSLTYKSKDIEQLAETKRKSNSSLSFEQSIEEARTEIYNQLLVDIKSAFTNLRSAREVLGDKTDDASIEEFRLAADLFYKSSAKVFQNLKTQAEKTFEGTVDFQGKNNKIYSKYIKGYKNIAKIKDDEIIVDVKVSSTLSNAAIGTAKSKNGKPVSEAEEKHMMRDATRPDFIVPREYEKDILNKKLTYEGFKPQGVSTEVNLDASLEANEKKKQSLMAEIQAKEEEKKSLDTEISILDNRIEELTKKNKAISQKRKDAAKEKVSDFEATQQQLSHEILMLEEKVGNGKTGEEQRIGSLTKDIEEQLRKRASAEEQLAQLSELDVERKKKELGVKISELETESPKLQDDLIKAQTRYNIAESDRVIAQADVYKASAALKAIPNTKKNAVARAEAESTLNQAQFALSDATEKVNEASKDVDFATKSIERNEKQISNLKSQISETTLESIREEQLSRIRAINDVITSLENEFETLMAQKSAKETTLVKVNKELEKSRNAVVLTTERELDSAISERDKLKQQKTRADSTIKSDQGAIENLEQTNKRVQAEIEYNKLLEKSLMLQGSINKMTEDEEPENKIEKKRKQLEKVNNELTEAEAKVQALGGFLGQGNEREYSDGERKTYALNELKKIEDDLITARAQKRVSESRISKKDREIADLDRWGLGAGVGASKLGRTKDRLTSEFMDSDYVQSQVNALREKTKAAITESENESRKIFDKKVAMAMEHLNWNPLDQTQVQKFLNTKHGQQLSNDFASEVDTNTTNIWKQYDEYRKDLLTKLKTEFQDSFKTDKGVLTATSKVQDETGQWIDEIVEVRVKEALRARLEEEKRILEAKHEPIQGNIDRLEAEKATAIEYGGVSEAELLSGKIIEDQIAKEIKLTKWQEKQIAAQETLNELEAAGTDHSSEDYKTAKKALSEAEKQVGYYDMLVKNRQKLVQMRYDESKEPTYTDEEKELHFTNQIVSYNEKIENSLAKQKTLKEQIASATGDDKTKLQRQLSIEEENVAKWCGKIPTFENKLSRLRTSKSQGVIGGIMPEGGLIGGVFSQFMSMLEGLGAGVEINTEDLAKDATLRAILEILGGVPSDDNGYDLCRGEDDGYGLGRGKKKTFSEYNDAVSVGYDRIQKLQKIRDGGTTGQFSTSELLRVNEMVWDKVKENNFFNDIPEDGSQRFTKITEVIRSTVNELLQTLGITEDQLVQQLQGVRNATGGYFKDNSHDSGWNHFATYNEKGNKHPVRKDNGVTYKVYAAFENIQDLNADIVSSIMKELSDAGFKGRLKTTSGSTASDNKTHAVVSTDQLVIHGSSKNDQEIAYNVLKKMGLNLSYLGGGIDTPDGSFTQTLSSDSIGKYVSIKQKQIPVEPEIQPGAVAEEVKENVADVPAKADVIPVANTETTQSNWIAKMSEEERKLAVDYINEYNKKKNDEWKQMDATALAKEINNIVQHLKDLSGDEDSVEYLKVQRELGQLLNIYKDKSAVKDRATVTRKNGNSYIDPKILAQEDPLINYLRLYDKYIPITSNKAVKNMFAMPQNKSSAMAKEVERDVAEATAEGVIVPITDGTIETVKSIAHRNVSKAQIYKDIQTSANTFYKTDIPKYETPLNAVTDILNKLSQVTDTNSRQYVELQRKLGQVLQIYGKAEKIESGKGFYDKIYESLNAKGVSIDKNLPIVNAHGLSSALIEKGLVNIKEKKPRIKVRSTTPSDETSQIQNLDQLKQTLENLKQMIVTTESNEEQRQQLQSAFIETLRSWSKNEASGLGGKALNAKEWKNYLISNKVFDKIDTSVTPLTNRQLNKGSKAQEPVPVKDEQVADTKTSQQTTNRQATGGLIQIVSQLATENTLLQVLSALQSLGTTEGGVTAPTAAGDLYNQFRALLLGGSIDDHERLAYMNSEEGLISGNVIGNITNISDKLIRALRAKYPAAQGFDTQIHTHGKSSKPYFSKEDYQHFTKDYESGIKKQVLLTKDHISVLDLSAVKSAEEVRALMDELIKAGNNAKAIKKVFENNKSGAMYESAKFDSLNANSLVKMIGVNVNSSGTTNKIDALVSKLQDAKSRMEKAIGVGYLSSQDKNLDSFKNILKQIQDISVGIENGTTSYEGQRVELERLINLATRYNDIVDNTIRENKRAYFSVSGVDTVNKQQNKIVSMFDTKDEFDNTDMTLIQQYNKAVQDLNATYQTLSDNRQLQNKEERHALSQQASRVQALGKHLISSINQYKQLKQYVDQTGTYMKNGGVYDLGGISEKLSENEIKNLESTMRNYVQNTLEQANIENVKFNNTKQQLIYTFRTSKDTVADMVVQYNEATRALYAYNKQERESLIGWKAFVQGFKSKLKSITQYMFSISSITRVWSELRQGVQYIREIDDALTELKKVTDETEETYDKFLNTAAKTAEKVGSTIKEVVSSTADWSRLGYSMKEAAKLAESTAVLLNVSEFQSIDDATSALTSTLQAFGYVAEDSMQVVDVLNEVGKLVAHR